MVTYDQQSLFSAPNFPNSPEAGQKNKHPPIQIHHITHCDLDGAGCSTLMNLYASEENGFLITYYCDHESINQTVQAAMVSVETAWADYLKKENAKIPTVPLFEIWITDISVSPDVAKQLDEFSKERQPWFHLRLFDHHKTALPLAEKYRWAIVKTHDAHGNQTCATRMLFLHLAESIRIQASVDLAKFVEDVRDYDTYVFKDNGNQRAEHINSILSVLGLEDFVAYMLDTLHNKTYDSVLFGEIQVLSLVESFYKSRKIYVDKVVSEAKEHRLGRYRCMVGFATKHISHVGAELLEAYPKCDLSVIISLPRSISFRASKSKPGIDVFEIAKEFGGGGHAQAAGAVLGQDILPGIVDVIFKPARKKLESIEYDGWTWGDFARKVNMRCSCMNVVDVAFRVAKDITIEILWKKKIIVVTKHNEDGANEIYYFYDAIPSDILPHIEEKYLK